MPQQAIFHPPRPGGPNPALDPDLLLPHCWRLQDCSSCLETKYHCSWCAASSACVPNPVTWPLLAPIWNPDVCPTRDERWELRGKELGCRVSTTTFLSVVVAVFATLGVLLLGWVGRIGWAWGKRRRKRWGVWWKEVGLNARAGFEKWAVDPWKDKVWGWSRWKSKRPAYTGPADEASRLLG